MAGIRRVVIGSVLAIQGFSGFSDDTATFRVGAEKAAFGLYKSGRFKEAAFALRPFAEQGNARAQLYLATLYRTGAGVDENEYEASKWYRKAAESGVAEAQFHLGLMYLEAIGVTENSDEALEWISRASGQGFGEAIEVFRYMLNHDEVLAC